MSDLQEPPHDDDAERSLLGAVMVDSSTLDTICSQLNTEDFYRPGHRYIFEAMRSLYERGCESIDPINLSDELQRNDKLESVGGPGYLTRLSNEVPSAANAGEYLRIVDEHSRVRDLISKASSIAQEGQSVPEDVSEFLDRAARDIHAVTQSANRSDYRHIKDVIKGAYEQIEEAAKSSDDVTGLPTGWTDLDALISGWEGGDLNIIAARPGMGKTSLALNNVDHLAVECGVPVAKFSMEMSAEKLAIRLLCQRARVNNRKVKKGMLSDEEWNRLVDAAAKLKSSPILIDDTAALSISEFRSKARRMQAEEGVEAIFIDYLQLMRAAGSHGTREQEIAEVSRMLKATAKELDIPVIALAQLNRGVESRQDKRPKVRDLRESGQIEQDADVIAFLYRDEVYNEDSEDQGIAEVIVRKQRSGPIGDVRLRWVAEHTRFESLAEQHQPSGPFDGG